MSVYQCEECGCAENTALSNYWWEHVMKKGPKLCSACTKIGPKPAGWHGRFDRVFLPKGMFVTNHEGNLVHKETGESWRSYRMNASISIEPGQTWLIHFNAGNPNNRTIHVRAVVDDDIVVFRVWSARKKAWVYETQHIAYFNLLAKEESLTLKRNKS